MRRVATMGEGNRKAFPNSGQQITVARFNIFRQTKASVQLPSKHARIIRPAADRHQSSVSAGCSRNNWAFLHSIKMTHVATDSKAALVEILSVWQSGDQVEG